MIASMGETPGLWFVIVDSLRELSLLTMAGVFAIKWELIHTGEDQKPKLKPTLRRPVKKRRRTRNRREEMTRQMADRAICGEPWLLTDEEARDE